MPDETPDNSGLTPDSTDEGEVKDTSVTPTDENSDESVDTEVSEDVVSEDSEVEEEPVPEPAGDDYVADEPDPELADEDTETHERENPDVAQPGEVQPNSVDQLPLPEGSKPGGALGAADKGTPVPEEPYSGESNSPEAEVNEEAFNPYQSPVEGEGYDYLEPKDEVQSEDVDTEESTESEVFENPLSPETQNPEANIASRDNIVPDESPTVSEQRVHELQAAEQELQSQLATEKYKREEAEKTVNSQAVYIAELEHKLATQ